MDVKAKLKHHKDNCPNSKESFEFAGCPYAERNRPDSSKTLYRCKHCGLEILQTTGNQARSLWLWDGADTFKPDNLIGGK